MRNNAEELLKVSCREMVQRLLQNEVVREEAADKLESLLQSTAKKPAEYYQALQLMADQFFFEESSVNALCSRNNADSNTKRILSQPIILRNFFISAVSKTGVKYPELSCRHTESLANATSRSELVGSLKQFLIEYYEVVSAEKMDRKSALFKSGKSSPLQSFFANEFVQALIEMKLTASQVILCNAYLQDAMQPSEPVNIFYRRDFNALMKSADAWAECKLVESCAAAPVSRQ